MSLPNIPALDECCRKLAMQNCSAALENKIVTDVTFNVGDKKYLVKLQKNDEYLAFTDAVEPHCSLLKPDYEVSKYINDYIRRLS